MSKTVEFFFDLGSPASYLAHTQLPDLCRETGATLVYRPMLLGGVFQATGNASPAMIPAKGRYMIRDLARFAERYGVPMRFNPHFPINTLTLMRLLVALQLRQPERFDDALQALFRAIWVDGVNLGDPLKVADVLVTAGFDAAELQAQAAEPAVKDALKATTDEAIRRGVFGAPTCFVGNEMFFGQDRLDFVRAALKS
ncbi:2-hydroxychromene-2-carboxylate isomerase [Pseudomonas sp. GD03721]|jgi:2-hydroxychromene-2-carboxylate isomerase|nr:MULTISPECIES: 2-hydroxychromene-2-carboxylate isomerase [Pseudomonas]MDH1441101.1 2-hydroxychromene-2-carboxylate isomerase [Pseudomonas sp. GD03722]MDM9651855.1 2-hydroxychromene-2-carboxylate isomerase [Pseudomonas wenzhouensis]WGG00040.1 2-hydroxychromene-2-carboxylate isomerase [Pseudomonas sp. GD03721]WGG04204.1 2-hydroxychromene-2-carboxylate isomerase [Pseudomonas sp. GD03919]